ncbi:hypothetical protein BC938DRAFT_472372 [Jimgerdemannia flammicorona]|uniref:enoyl-[acyl-carrier-protein] reductase n=1 Tax=Jimgerdemannia flammicorona TaxID=994334 RepID=A0A433Q699_9FUNG|nr:hypothetical protein BC938DRAFT_472372 [Jimgerdemannia flammicorona]
MLAPTLLLARSAVRLRTCAIPNRRQFTATSSSGIIAKALVYSQYGRPTEVLRLHSHPLPVLTPSTIHLRFLAAPINPADVNQIEGAYPIKPPFRMDQVNSEVPVAVGGNEGVAEVIAVGDEVSDVKVGDWVVTARSGFGTWRTHAVATPAEVEVIPREGLSLVQAATITVNSCTAYRMLKDFVNLGEGDFVIQNAANSSVGQVVIEIAKVLGIKTINIVRNRPNIAELTARLTAIGATHVLTDDELGKVTTKEKIKEWTGGEPILLGLNCVGGRDATELARYLG